MNLTIPDLSLYTVLIHLFLSLGLCYACFCRLTKTSKDTPVRVRLVLFITADVALFLAGAPFFWGLTPSPWINALLAASLASKIVSSELWKHGVPDGYSSPDKPLFETSPTTDLTQKVEGTEVQNLKQSLAKESVTNSSNDTQPLAKL